MQKENRPKPNKTELRSFFLRLRNGLSPERKAEAGHALVSYLEQHTAAFLRIASFSPMNGEIDLAPFNKRLARENRLLLPRCEGDELVFHPTELGPHDLVLVPGVAFDKDGYRLGLGKGYYDRLLARMPDAITWGVGFREQFCNTPLCIDPWDLPVRKVLLF